MKTIDACGISCPEPLIILRKALNTEKDFVLLLDNKIAFENCTSYATRNGYEISVAIDNEIYKMKISVGK
jgi:TusA-related sulfurtransferase